MHWLEGPCASYQLAYVRVCLEDTRRLEISSFSDILNGSSEEIQRRSFDPFMFEHISNKLSESIYYLTCILEKYEETLETDEHHKKYKSLHNYIETFDKLNIIFSDISELTPDRPAAGECSIQ